MTLLCLHCLSPCTRHPLCTTRDCLSLARIIYSAPVTWTSVWSVLHRDGWRPDQSMGCGFPMALRRPESVFWLYLGTFDGDFHDTQGFTNPSH